MNVQTEQNVHFQKEYLIEIQEFCAKRSDILKNIIKLNLDHVKLFVESPFDQRPNFHRKE